MGPVTEAALYPTPDNAASPDGAASFIAVQPDLKIRIARFRGGKRGTVLVLPGRTECVEKYFETISELQSRGFSVAAIDWRGQGASTRPLRDPLKGHVLNFAEFVEDFAAMLEMVEVDMPKPFVMLAHSMGGNIALRALHDFPGRFAGAVLSAPMLSIRQAPGFLVLFLSRFLAPDLFVPGTRYDPYTERFESNVVTHDQRRFARNQGIATSHRALALGSPTWGWLQAAIASNALILRKGYLEAIKTPVLLLSAEAERIIENSAHVLAAKKLRRVTQVVVQGARHEILQETDDIRREFWRRFDSFMNGIVK